MYKDLLDFLREKVDILEVHEVIDQIESAEDLPQVNSHLAEQLEMLLAEFVEDNYPNAFLGQQFLSSFDMKEILEDL
jgi:uncharacterized protein YjgD (DUF1641 family)